MAYASNQPVPMTDAHTSRRRHAVAALVLLGVLVAERILIGYFTGALFVEPFSDEFDHFSRSVYWQQLFVTLQPTPAVLRELYAMAGWPPLHTFLVGIAIIPFDNDLVAGRIFMSVCNALSVTILFFFCGRTFAAALLIALVGLLWPSLLTMSQMIRPENTALLLTAIVIALIATTDFSPGARSRQWLRFAAIGAVLALGLLNHASMLFMSAGLLIYGFFFVNRRGFLIAAVACVVVVAPWQLVVSINHRVTDIITTTGPINLWVNNNPFLNNDYSNFEEVRRQAQDLGDEKAAASGLELRKPFTIPQQFYEIWLGHERRRQAYRELAVDSIRQDPLGAVERAFYRVASTLRVGEFRGTGPYAGSALWRTFSVLQPIDRAIVLLGSLAATIMLAIWSFSPQARLFMVAAWCGWLPLVVVASLGRVMLPSVLLLTAAVATMLSDARTRHRPAGIAVGRTTAHS